MTSKISDIMLFMIDIKATRLKLELTQEELAHRLGVS